MESLKINGYTLDYIKRVAKQAKKDRKIKHCEALDIAAWKFGFKNYKDCLTQFKK